MHFSGLLPRRYFRDFFLGRSGTVIAVAVISEQVGLMLSSQAQHVCLERGYAEKLLVKNRLTYEHLHLVQKAIDRGYCFSGKKSSHFEFVYFTKSSKGGDIKLVLKTAAWGQEVWLVTMHHTNPAQYRSMRRKQPLLREHIT